MWEGTTTTGDAQSILDIVERSVNEDITVIFGADGVNPKALFDAFGKAEQIRLQQLFNQRFKGGFGAAMKNIVEPIGAVSVAPYLNDQTFRERWNTGLNVALALLKKSTDAGKCSFPRPNERRIDDTNWQPFQSNKDLIVRAEGFSPKSAAPFDAVDLLLANLDKWTCDCRLFPEIVMLYAWHEALKDNPQAFNNKFANLVLGPEGTTGLEREIVETDADPAWKNAPVGTKVAWENTSMAAKVPWTHEHGIKTFKGKLDEEDRYAAHPLGYDLTEQEVKEKLAQSSSDYPWTYKITVDSLQGLMAEGIDAQVVASLRTIQDLEVKGFRAFLDLGPLVNLRKQAKQDPSHFSELINKILKYARNDAKPEDAQAYVATNIHRFKLEIPK
jgi:hypothetical protein